jgi:hypothetical protein
MKKLIGLAAIGMFAAGCSGSGNGTSTSGSTGSTAGTSTGQTTSGATNGTSASSTNGNTSAGGSAVTGPLAFSIGKTVAIFQGLSDGGVDPTFLEIDFTNDSSDACLLQEQGYPDGGSVAGITEFGQLDFSVPSGIQLNVPYNSVTAQDLAIHAADGGGVPSGGFIQAFIETPTNGFTSIGGSATITSISNTSIAATLNSVTMAFEDGGNSSALSGTLNVTDQSCVLQLQPQ